MLFVAGAQVQFLERQYARESEAIAASLSKAIDARLRAIEVRLKDSLEINSDDGPFVSVSKLSRTLVAIPEVERAELFRRSTRTPGPWQRVISLKRGEHISSEPELRFDFRGAPAATRRFEMVSSDEGTGSFRFLFSLERTAAYGFEEIMAVELQPSEIQSLTSLDGEHFAMILNLEGLVISASSRAGFSRYENVSHLPIVRESQENEYAGVHREYSDLPGKAANYGNLRRLDGYDILLLTGYSLRGQAALFQEQRGLWLGLWLGLWFLGSLCGGGIHAYVFRRRFQDLFQDLGEPASARSATTSTNASEMNPEEHERAA